MIISIKASRPQRIFETGPGAYGNGIEGLKAIESTIKKILL